MSQSFGGVGAAGEGFGELARVLTSWKSIVYGRNRDTTKVVMVDGGSGADARRD